MKCANCNSKINNDLAFCPKCGTAVEKKKSRKGTIIALIGILLFLIVLICFGIFYVMDISNKFETRVQHKNSTELYIKHYFSPSVLIERTEKTSDGSKITTYFDRSLNSDKNGSRDKEVETSYYSYLDNQTYTVSYPYGATRILSKNADDSSTDTYLDKGNPLLTDYYQDGVLVQTDFWPNTRTDNPVYLEKITNSIPGTLYPGDIKKDDASSVCTFYYDNEGNITDFFYGENGLYSYEYNIQDGILTAKLSHFMIVNNEYIADGPIEKTSYYSNHELQSITYYENELPARELIYSSGEPGEPVETDTYSYKVTVLGKIVNQITRSFSDNHIEKVYFSGDEYNEASFLFSEIYDSSDSLVKQIEKEGTSIAETLFYGIKVAGEDLRESRTCYDSDGTVLYAWEGELDGNSDSGKYSWYEDSKLKYTIEYENNNFTRTVYNDQGTISHIEEGAFDEVTRTIYYDGETDSGETNEDATYDTAETNGDNEYWDGTNYIIEKYNSDGSLYCIEYYDRNKSDFYLGLMPYVIYYYENGYISRILEYSNNHLTSDIHKDENGEEISKDIYLGNESFGYTEDDMYFALEIKYDNRYFYMAEIGKETVGGYISSPYTKIHYEKGRIKTIKIVFSNSNAYVFLPE